VGTTFILKHFQCFQNPSSLFGRHRTKTVLKLLYRSYLPLIWPLMATEIRH
jgi:hypothetical protein